MGSMKRQIMFLSVLMAIVIMALTLVGLQLFGNGKAKPSEWFKKADTPQAEQTAPETTSYVSSALFAENEEKPTFEEYLASKNLTEKFVSEPQGYIVLKNNVNDTVTSQGVRFSSFSGMENAFEIYCTVYFPKTSPLPNYDVVSVNVQVYTFAGNEYISPKFHDNCLEYYSVDFMRYAVNSDRPWGIVTYELTPKPSLPLPAEPTKEGHTFAGWYYGTQAEHGSSCRVYDGAPIYEDTALHAHFNINRYTVTYDVAGGTPIESEVLNWNTIASAPTPIRIGYNFKGWALADGSIYNNSPIKQNTTLTARWEIKIFTVTFYVDGDNGEEAYATLEVPYGSTLAEAMEEAEIISYKAMDISGLRVSKQSVITEDTQVLVQELTGWEKYGDFVGRNKWFTWVIVGIVGALGLTAAISITVAVKRK